MKSSDLVVTCLKELAYGKKYFTNNSRIPDQNFISLSH
jgi:hypothetical protein